MTEEFELESQRLKAFMLLHRIRELIFRCQDRVVAEFELTTEQYSVLAAMKYLDTPIRITDIAQWMEHKVNSVSMLVDRMVKAGLLKRIRDLPDRRELRLVITRKGEQAFKLANPRVRKLINEISSPLSSEEINTLIKLLEILSNKALEHCHPEANAQATVAYETNEVSSLLKRVSKYISK